MDKKQFIAVAVVIAFGTLVVLTWSWNPSEKKKQAPKSGNRSFLPAILRSPSKVFSGKDKPRPSEPKKDEPPAPPAGDVSVETVEVKGGGATREAPGDSGASAPEPEAPPQVDKLPEVTEALNALSPTRGIDALMERLAELENMDEAAQIYTALGTLHANAQDPEAAGEAFEQAVGAARSQEERDEAGYRWVNMLVNAGEPAQALAKTQELVRDSGQATVRNLEMRLMAGNLHEQKGEHEQAEKVFLDVMDKSLAASATARDDWFNVHRQASLALVRLYRDTGREDEAQRVTRQFKQRERMRQEGAATSAAE